MVVVAQRPAYVQYRHRCLDEAERFLADFGMVQCGRDDKVAYFRGVEPRGYCYIAHAGDPEFIGGAFEVESLAQLEIASRSISNASKVKDLPGPLGGAYVELRDPDGFRIDLVAEMSPLDPLPETVPPILNFGNKKQRFGQFQRFEPGPARVRKLGHFGFNVSNFARSYAWYRSNLGLLASDTLYAEKPEEKIAAFMRVGVEGDWVDHHSLFFLESPVAHIHHCSFEVQDMDEVMMGSEWLKSQGWKQFWGVGRHILGSQIFDYWRDCSGFMIEHYADGDLLGHSHQVGNHCVADEALSVWGPAPPTDFLD